MIGIPSPPFSFRNFLPEWLDGRNVLAGLLGSALGLRLGTIYLHPDWSWWTIEVTP